MAHIGGIKEHMDIIGADGVHVGTVDKVEGDRIKLTKQDAGEGRHKGHHHYLSTGLVAEVEGDRVRLSANAANAFMFEEESDGSARSSPSAGKAAGLGWGSVGIGAAAIGAVAGAALLARNQNRDRDDFALRLQTDESLRLISSSKVEGTPVVGRSGEHLGKIESFMVDKYSGRVAYAVMSFGGTLGFGDSLFPLPWSYLNYDVDKDGYVLDITKEQIAAAPKFKASDAPEFSTSYRQGLAQFYGRTAI
jgi:hypothetical protein